MTDIEFFQVGANRLPSALFHRLCNLGRRGTEVLVVTDNDQFYTALEQRMAALTLSTARLRSGEQPAVSQHGLLVNFEAQLPKQFGQFDTVWEIIGTDVDSSRDKYRFYKARGYAVRVTKWEHHEHQQTSPHTQQSCA